jgi:hypothetical protein
MIQMHFEFGVYYISLPPEPTFVAIMERAIEYLVAARLAAVSVAKAASATASTGKAT